MDSEQLRYFVSAAQSLNFSEAARRHFISQPAISHHISALESELGVELFLRVGRQVLLTSSGELFLKEALELLKRMDEASERVRWHRDGKVGQISLCLVDSSHMAFVKCLRVFSERYPDVQSDVKTLSGMEQSLMISEGRGEIFFTVEPIISNYDAMEYVISDDDRYCLAVPKSMGIPFGEPDFQALRDVPVAATGFTDAPILHSQIMSICANRNFKPRLVNYYNRMRSALLAVSAGAAVSILPYSLCGLYSLENIDCIPIPGDDAVLHSVIAWRKDETNETALKFRDIVLELYPKE